MSIQKIIISFFLEPISYFLTFGALLVYLKIKGRQIRHTILVVYQIIGVGLLVGTFFARPNNYLYSYLYLLTGISFSLYFFFLFESHQKRWLTLLIGVLTMLYYSFERFMINGEKLFPSIGFVITSSGILIMVFIYFYLMMRNVSEEPITQNFDFWLMCSQLAYHLGAFGIFLTYNKLTLNILSTEQYSNENRALLTSLWGAHNILLFIGSLITWVGVILIVREHKREIIRDWNA